MDAASTFLFCPKCATAINATDAFCPHCGAHLQPLSMSVGRQFYMYAVSLFLPPIGLMWVRKYFKNPDPKAHTIAWIIIALTVVSVIFTVWIGLGYISSVQQQMQGISTYGQYTY